MSELDKHLRPATKKDIDHAVEKLAVSAKKTFDKVDGRLERIKGDVAELKSDVKELTGDVRELKDDVKELKQGQSGLIKITEQNNQLLRGCLITPCLLQYP